MYESRTYNRLVPQIKTKLRQLLYKVSLGHLSARKGVFGIEHTDQLAKQAIFNATVNHHVPMPHSLIE